MVTCISEPVETMEPRRAVLSRARRPRREVWSWWHLLQAIALVGLAIAVCSDAWADIVSIALRDEESSHVLVAPMVVLWLVWMRRGRFRYLKRQGNLAGCLIVLMGWLTYSLGDTCWVQVMWHGGALLMAIGAVVTVVGTEVLVEFAPAFVAILFVIPVPGRLRQHIALPMESATAAITQHLLEFFGAGVERSGNLLLINGVSVAIGEACNGLRMIASLGLVMFTFAFGTPLRGLVRLVLLGATPIFAIFANVLRLLPTVWIYGNCSNATAERFHDITGWVMLFACFGALVGLLRLMRWAMLPVGPFRLAYD